MLGHLTIFYCWINSWSRYYSQPEIPPTVRVSVQTNQYKFLNPGDLYIFQTIFTSLTETEGNGGALLIESDTKLLIEYSNFICCNSKGKGGAIYFNNVNGESALKMVCSSNSSSIEHIDHFCYILTKNNMNSCTNYIEQTSVTNVKSITNLGYNIDLFNSRIIMLKNSNISHNECYEYPTLHTSLCHNFSISYTTLGNNTANGNDVAVMCFRENDDNNMFTCNVIGNYADNSIMMLYSPFSVVKSSLLENGMDIPMFYALNDFYVAIDECSIDNDIKKDKYGTENVDYDHTDDFFTRNLNGMQYDECLFLNLSVQKCKYEEVQDSMKEYKKLIMKRSYLFLLLI